MFQQFKLNEVRLTDHDFAPRKELVREYLKQFDIERLLYSFKRNAGIPTEAEPLGGWETPDCGLRGHFTGHFLSACTRFACGDDDRILREKAEQIVDILRQCAKENGYLSAFPESVLDELEKEENRNVWAPYYTLHKIIQGLIDCYRFIGNEKALALALNLAKYIKARFEKLSRWKIDGILRCTKLNPVNEFGGIGDAFYQLWEFTGEEGILELAKLFDRDYFVMNLYRGRDILEDLHANTHLPMILSAMRRYEITGEEKYRKAAENFYGYLEGRTFANGNNSSRATHFIPEGVSETSEHWGGYRQLQGALTGGESESCCAHNTEKIAEKMFLWTGNRKYLDHMERLKYNAVLNSASRVTGLSQYHQPMGRGKKKEFSRPYDDFWCCTGSGIEAMSELQKDIWFKTDDAILVNLFVSSEVIWEEKGAVIRQETDYPDDSAVKYCIRTKNPVRFKLIWKRNRIERMKCNGADTAVRCEGDYCMLERFFADGDCIEATIKSDFHLEELQGEPEKCAVLYDQILLARIGDGGYLGNIREEDLPAELHREENRELSFSQALSNRGAMRWVPLFRIEDEKYTVYVSRTEECEREETGAAVMDGSHAYE